MATPTPVAGKMTIEAMLDALMGSLGTASDTLRAEAIAGEVPTVGWRAGRALTPGLKALGTAGRGLKAVGKLGMKGAGSGFAGGFLAYELLSSILEGRKHVRETERLTRPRTAEDMLAELDEQRSRQASLTSVAQNDPELLERLSWMLSGQQQPDLTPNQVMFGATPTAQNVSPEALQEAIAAMLG